MPNGIVKFFNAGKKFGFVSPDDGGKDVFVPFTSVAAAGFSTLVAGQRVSFETAPDARGPKAVGLKLIDAPVVAPATKKAAPSARAVGPSQQLTFYYDAANEDATETLAVLRKNGFDPRVVDYVAAPPSADELKKLSMHLGAGSLVRRYDPLFRDLRLDDRFIGQTEFWDGIVENPTLINGPILATVNRTCVCRSDDVMKDFLESIFPGRARLALEEIASSERAVTPAPEVVAVKAVAEGVTPDVTTLEEPAAPTIDMPAKKTAKVPRTKKVVAVKTAATKAAKKPFSKPVKKPTQKKTK